MKEKKKSRHRAASIVLFSGMAVEMAAIILAGTWGGKYLDQRFDTKPYLTVALSLFSVFVALYHMVKRILKWQK